MDMIDDGLNNERIARYFYENKIESHIVLNSGQFWNGLIMEVASDFFILDDKKEGHKVIFFQELKKPIEEFQEVGK